MLRDLSLHSVRRGGHNIPVTDLEGRAHSQGQRQSCAVVSIKSKMDGLKIIGRMETPFLALNCYGSFMFCLQETSFLQPVQPTLAKTAVQIQSETFILCYSHFLSPSNSHLQIVLLLV